MQATLLTGTLPREHGIVGNGWYFRDLSEVLFWRQSNALVAGEQIWAAARKRDAGFTGAKLFWWFNMYSGADYAVTPRPLYPADGRKIPDIYTEPAALRDELNAALGQFPLFDFWGPRAGIRSSRWIADAARRVLDAQQPTLTLLYLPHLDYELQRKGPRHPDIARALREVDDLVGELLEHARRAGTRVLVLSEYGITEVTGAGARQPRPAQGGAAPRARGAGPGEARRRGPRRSRSATTRWRTSTSSARSASPRWPLLRSVDGVETVAATSRSAPRPRSPALRRAGGHQPRRPLVQLLLLARRRPRAGLRAHPSISPQSPGTTVELFLDPALKLPQYAWACAWPRRRSLRYLMDVIPIDASLVKGSHGRITDNAAAGPMLLSSEPELLPEGTSHRSGPTFMPHPAPRCSHGPDHVPFNPALQQQR